MSLRLNRFCAAPRSAHIQEHRRRCLHSSAGRACLKARSALVLVVFILLRCGFAAAGSLRGSSWRHPSLRRGLLWRAPSCLATRTTSKGSEDVAFGVDAEQAAALRKLTVAELKERCREAGLRVSGRKAELIDRLSSEEMERPKRKRRRLGEEEQAASQSSATDAEEDVTQTTAVEDSLSEEVAPCLPRSKEQVLLAEGKSFVMGVDEAGRGPLAGPVVVGACAMPLGASVPGINDSKQIDEEGREELYEAIVNTKGVRWAVAVLDAKRIDEINILAATMEGMVMCCRALMDEVPPSDPADISRKGCYVVTGSQLDGTEASIRKGGCYALIDGNQVPRALPCRGEALVKGDGREYIIGAASILAKVTRDRLMIEYSKLYPDYELAKHKGYPTRDHIATVKKLGPTPIHRRSFAPLKTMNLPNDPLKKQNPWTMAKRRAAVSSATAAAVTEEGAGAARDSAESSSTTDAAVAEEVASEGFLSLESVDESWRDALQAEVAKPYFGELRDFLRSEYGSETVYPPPSKIFRSLELCPLDKIRVVILGQDPYHQPGQAHGLAFSVEKGVTIPRSLRNIYREIEADVGGAPPDHGNLEQWAAEGILLLNTVLTVRRSEAGCHQNSGWETFTDAVIKCVSDNCENVVFLLWGKSAHSKVKLIDTAKHYAIKTSHPSPLSASKTTRNCMSFLGSRCFSTANEYLEKKGKGPISWQIE